MERLDLNAAGGSTFFDWTQPVVRSLSEKVYSTLTPLYYVREQLLDLFVDLHQTPGAQQHGFQLLGHCKGGALLMDSMAWLKERPDVWQGDTARRAAVNAIRIAVAAPSPIDNRSDSLWG